MLVAGCGEVRQVRPGDLAGEGLGGHRPEGEREPGVYLEHLRQPGDQREHVVDLCELRDERRIDLPERHRQGVVDPRRPDGVHQRDDEVVPVQLPTGVLLEQRDRGQATAQLVDAGVGGLLVGPGMEHRQAGAVLLGLGPGEALEERRVVLGDPGEGRGERVLPWRRLDVLMRMHACLPVGGRVRTSVRRICRPVPRSPAGPAGSPGCPCGQRGAGQCGGGDVETRCPLPKAGWTDPSRRVSPKSGQWW
ncbi:hypothetical protein AB0M91_19070 [Micromonospora rifamycinica]|uniref:hypothetical protein n=1 Tax=Micromonospora rifamycinica TaxID=291594 RepID=UPI00344368F4